MPTETNTIELPGAILDLRITRDGELFPSPGSSLLGGIKSLGFDISSFLQSADSPDGGYQLSSFPARGNTSFSGALSKSKSKSKSKSNSSSKSKSKSKSKSLRMAGLGGDADVVSAPWEELRELLLTLFPANRKDAQPWENLPLPRPPDPDMTQREIVSLLWKQERLVEWDLRQREILSQVSSNELMEVLKPLSIDEDGYPATVGLIRTILDLTERVGYVYKRKFARLRPNQVSTVLRPFLGNPPHESYPSNHSFQLFSVAEAMTRMLPENPATTELFHIAQRVAENREYAGIHYASDSFAGRELARMFSPYLFIACRRQMRDALKEWL